MPAKYYFYKKKEEYLSEFNIQKRFSDTYKFNAQKIINKPKVVMYLCYLGGFGILFLILFKITSLIVYNEKQQLLSWILYAIGLVTSLIFLLLGYILSIIMRKIKNSSDIFVNDEGINLPFPYDKNFQHTFVKFTDISKITVVDLSSDIFKSKIIIYYNKKITTTFGIMSDNYAFYLKKDDLNKFINAIKLATQNKIPIEHKTDITI